MNKKIRILGFSLSMIIIIAVAITGIRSLVKPAALKEVDDYAYWDDRVVLAMQALPVQDGGRIKPFQTLARRYMYAMHGDRGMKVILNGEKHKLQPTEWLMDVMFRPEKADELPTFRVDNSEILEQAGMDVKSLRDRYSFNQIRPHLSKLGELAMPIEKKVRTSGRDSLTPNEEQMYDFVSLIRAYLALKNPFILSSEMKKSTGYRGMKDFLTPVAPQLERLYMDENKQIDLFEIISIIEKKIIADAQLRNEITRWGDSSKLIINPIKGEKVWKSIGERFGKVAKVNHESYVIYAKEVSALQEKHGNLDRKNVSAFFRDYMVVSKDYELRKSPYPESLKDELLELDKLQSSFDSGVPSKQLAAIAAFKKEYEDHIDFGDEGGSISGELLLNNWDYFNNCIAILLLAGVLLIAMCLCLGTKASKVLYWCVYGFTALACLLTIVGIAHRSIIMWRSPLGTLYDTMPFIVGAGLLLLLLIELIHRKAVLLGVSICFGVAILFLAKKYEVYEARDQMDPLVAVLKSNFWLSTHVVTITLGYMGGIVAACISHFYIIGRAFGVIDSKDDRKYLTKIVYGMVAFTLLFSLVGTILGGIWAADSWGRFWGWDPKENGALLIVIWMLVILHARLGGYIREIGLHVCSVFGFAIIVFSWWHVNFLGVGLHSYGFASSDAMTSIWMFYGMEFLIMLIGMGMAWVIYENKASGRIRKKIEREAAEGQS